MSSLAIIGAGGFVGQRLAETLVLSGTRARAIVRSPRNLAGLCRFGPALDIALADAENRQQLVTALTGVETAVNLTTGPPAGIVRSTAAIFDACVEAGVSRLVHVSSAVVYGDVLTPTGDDAPPLTTLWMPYARARAATEVWLRARPVASGPALVVLRPGIIWGPGSPHTLDIARSLAARNAFLVDEGAGVFNGIYIDNMIASILAVNRDAAPGGFYNIGDRETVTWRQLFAALGPALHCNPDELARVSGTSCPRSLGSTIERLQSLPLMNELYHRLKKHVPESFKAAIKAKLEGPYDYERHAIAYARAPGVSRESWHLQRVRYKLPIDKFGQAYSFTPPVSFADGIRRTLAWLDNLGLVSDSWKAADAVNYAHAR